MNIQEVIKVGVFMIGETIQARVLESVESKDKTAFALFTPAGLCLIGISQIGSQADYVDVRWRVFIGEITPSFDFGHALSTNYACPDTPYGMVVLGGKKILTITDTYRFLSSWGAFEIQQIMNMRFCGALLMPGVPQGVIRISGECYAEILQKHGLNKLLSTHPTTQ